MGSNPAMSAKFNFSLNKDFGAGSVDLDVSGNADLVKALANPSETLPDGDAVLIGGQVGVGTGDRITLGPAKIGFSADANASIGVFSTPAALRSALFANEDLVSEITDALEFHGGAGSHFLMLRWGYDIAGTAAGSVALGGSGTLTFQANAEREGYYAIIQNVASDAKAKASLGNLVSSWRLPSQVHDIADLPPRTTFLSEVDGSFGLKAGVTFGYDFNWLREVDGLGLKGDIGLKLKAGLTASIGFGLAGKYAVLLSREDDSRKARMRLYKLKVSNWNFGFDASLVATPVTPPLPENFDDLLRAVTGTHGQQIMKLLGKVEDWTDPAKPVFGPFVNLADSEAQKLLRSLTGVSDLAAAFDQVKGRIQKLFSLWDALPQTVTQLIWSKLPASTEISSIAAIANKVAGLTEDSLGELIASSLANVPFLTTTEGKTLEALAAKGLFAALDNSDALKDIQKAAGKVGEVLDGSELQSLLTKLQDAVNTKLDLKKIESVVDQTTFDSLDTWLKARLEDFLEQRLVGPQGVAEINKLRAGLKAILDKKDELYAKALAALKRDYEFSIHATYQKTKTSSALLDVAFDFDVPSSQAATGLNLALAGKFDQLLMATLTGVKINEGVLAFGIRKESHVSISLPYFSTSSTHVNEALAQLQVVGQDAGGLVFSLTASDVYTQRNDYSSALSIALSVPAGKTGVSIHSTARGSYHYDLEIHLTDASAKALALQYAPYADSYFSGEFGKGTFSDWVNQIAPAGGKIGNCLVSLGLSLQSSAVQAWLKAPADKKDPVYKRMSMALQEQFKKMLHDTYFEDLRHYKDIAAVYPLLGFCSIPSFCGVQIVNQGAGFKLLDATASGEDLYWDYRDTGQNSFHVNLRKQVLFHPGTKAKLQELLGIAHARLTEAGDPDHVLSFYSAGSVDQILNETLEATSLLDGLFSVEAGLVEQARKAGTKMAAFKQNQFSKPEQARKDLAEFGLKLSEDFNKGLKNAAVGKALLPLGTAVYITAAKVLDPNAAAPATAMFTVRTLQPGVSTLTPADTDILRTNRVVHAT